jgi:hypothetical protein
MENRYANCSCKAYKLNKQKCAMINLFLNQGQVRSINLFFEIKDHHDSVTVSAHRSRKKIGFNSFNGTWDERKNTHVKKYVIRNYKLNIAKILVF